MSDEGPEVPVVLVVEDDALIRMAAASALGQAGFDVVQAANADEAMAILMRGDRVAVLFTDIQMPGSMDGTKLAWLTAAERPQMGIIVTSGAVSADLPKLPPAAKYVAKPYDLRLVTAAVRARCA